MICTPDDYELNRFSGYVEEDPQRFQAKSNMADEPRDFDQNKKKWTWRMSYRL